MIGENILSAMVPAWMVLTFSAIIFSIGLVGLVIRRNVLIVLMCIELMLNAVNLVFVVGSKMHSNLSGELSVLFVMIVAAAESAVGLGLVIALFRTLRTVNTFEIQVLKE